MRKLNSTITFMRFQTIILSCSFLFLHPQSYQATKNISSNKHAFRDFEYLVQKNYSPELVFYQDRWQAIPAESTSVATTSKELPAKSRAKLLLTRYKRGNERYTWWETRQRPRHRPFVTAGPVGGRSAIIKSLSTAPPVTG